MRWQREEKFDVSEEKARQQNDLLLQQSGWILQDRSPINLAAGSGVAICEARLKTSEADYLSFAGGRTAAHLKNAHKEI